LASIAVSSCGCRAITELRSDCRMIASGIHDLTLPRHALQPTSAPVHHLETHLLCYPARPHLDGRVEGNVAPCHLGVP
jgi:hypothetical protein